MKTALTLLAALALVTLPHQAGAQIIIFHAGCGPQDSCSQPRPVSPRYGSVTPRRYVTPAQATTVVPPPRALRAPILPLRNIGFHIIYGTGTTDQDSFDGGGLGLSYMMGRSWGLEATVEGYNGGSDSYGEPSYSLKRLGIAALWFPGGVHQNGFSFYAKGGLLYQNLEYFEGGFDELSSTTLQAGVGLQLRFLDGLFSLGVEALFVGPMEESDDEYSCEPLSSSFAIRLTSGIHF